MDSVKTAQLQRIAKLVKEHAPRTDRYDAHHAYICDVHAILVKEGQFFRGLDAFKALLVEATKTRALDLSRADFVEAMDPDRVRHSEIRYHCATFHFIVT